MTIIRDKKDYNVASIQDILDIIYWIEIDTSELGIEDLNTTFKDCSMTLDELESFLEYSVDSETLISIQKASDDFVFKISIYK